MSDIAFNPAHVPIALTIASGFMLAGIVPRVLAGAAGRALSRRRAGHTPEGG